MPTNYICFVLKVKLSKKLCQKISGRRESPFWMIFTSLTMRETPVGLPGGRFMSDDW
ncbi:hypothetical protein Pcar_3279 [Syntrophotalea carbinolica DSM 2380]|uniref:Uncharacterized protein n=1 Tax=Syntrophotalea carbinolica (strain DSM 2380 / NBRC 103641 / GraBd1) TaxID=338963 RepID=Q0C6N9_SYNC1|nr:hypothetical protein Pcar_3279 [Syntrophotalea carbinolica DSM 2380]